MDWRGAGFVKIFELDGGLGWDRERREKKKKVDIRSPL